MKRTTTLGLTTLLLLSATPVAAQDRPDPMAALEGSSVDLATLPQTVPFRSVAGHIVVDVLLGDATEPLPFILDTGAPVTYSDQVAADYAGAPVGSVQEEAIAGTIITTDVVAIDSLDLGGARFQNVAGTKGFLEPDNPLSCISDHGIIGASLMKEAVWQIDYEAREVTIAPSVEGLDHIDGATTLDFVGANAASPSPVIGFLTHGGILPFLLDTGSDGDLTLNPAELEAAGVTVDPTSPTLDLIGSGMAGTFKAPLTYVAVDLGIGTTLVEAYPVATAETLDPGIGNIGNRFLEKFVLTIDWPGKKVYLDPVAEDDGIPRPDEPSAATLSWDGENVVVGSVARGSAAAEAGLEVGAVVSAVDGTDYSSALRDDFCALHIGDQPETFSLTTAHGQTFDIGPVDGFYDALGGTTE